MKKIPELTPKVDKPEGKVPKKRQPISKRVRFEVFKRDSFKCQYCGKFAPEAVLHVDHISPVSKGGTADILNLITSCADCNSGKSDIPLSDNSAIQKQRVQLEELNERREQLEMLLEWREGLQDITDQAVTAIAEAWEGAAVGFHLNERGLQGARRYLAQHGLNAILDAIEVAKNNYIKLDNEGKATQESVEIGWRKVGGILRMGDQPEWKRQIFYVRGILRNRFSLADYPYRYIIDDMQAAFEAGVSVEKIKSLALSAGWFRQFEERLAEAVKQAKESGEGDGR